MHTGGVYKHRHADDQRGLQGSQSTVVATYLYDPFGKTIGQWGELADEFKFRFSTKYWDGETYYYCYRDYDPNTKTWLTRDPLGEGGGMNLYAFCSNRSIN